MPRSTLTSVQILDISLFVRGKFLSAETRRGNYEQIGERIDITYDGIDGENVSAEELIKPEIKDQKGLTVVSRKFSNPSVRPALMYEQCVQTMKQVIKFARLFEACWMRPST